MKTSRQKQKLEIKGKLRTKLETEKDIKRIPLAGTGKTDSCRGIFTQQITGVEPAFPAWEASVLPMNHICIVLVYHFFAFIQAEFSNFYAFTKFVCTVCHSCSLQYDMILFAKKELFFSFHQQHD